MAHVIQTTHVQRLIGNAADLVRRVNGKEEGTEIGLLEGQRTISTAFVEHALEKAVVDLRHAADELDEERMSCTGWAQT